MPMVKTLFMQPALVRMLLTWLKAKTVWGVVFDWFA